MQHYRPHRFIAMTIHLQIEMIETYNDFSYIMYIICEMTASYYSRIKNIVNIPIIICSTGLSILNTTEFSDSTFDKVVVIRNCGIAFNLLIALSIAILNAYKITEKEFSFKTHSVNFLKIHNKINIDLAKCKTTMSHVDILDIVKEYNMLCESLCFHIPSHIQRFVKHNYRNYKQPFMISQPKKGRRASIISYYFNNDDTHKSSDSTALTVTSTNTENSEDIERDIENGPSEICIGISENASPVVENNTIRPKRKKTKRSPINALNCKFRKSFEIKHKTSRKNVKKNETYVQNVIETVA